MAIEAKTGQTLRVTVKKAIVRESARKTIERLFMTDKAVSGPVEARSANFEAKPKRRGGRIWTKYPNKIHPEIKPGDSATIRATPQAIKDLKSVDAYVNVQAQ